MSNTELEAVDEPNTKTLPPATDKPPLTAEQNDLLERELETDGNIILEETRYTALAKMVDVGLIQFSARIEKKLFWKIMKNLTFCRLYKSELKQAMKQSPHVAEIVYADCNLYLEQILDYMKLSIAKDGWRAQQFFKTLAGDEKQAKRFGIFERDDNKEIKD